jgi:hypothetical protein
VVVVWAVVVTEGMVLWQVALEVLWAVVVTEGMVVLWQAEVVMVVTADGVGDLLGNLESMDQDLALVGVAHGHQVGRVLMADNVLGTDGPHGTLSSTITIWSTTHLT